MADGQWDALLVDAAERGEMSAMARALAAGADPLRARGAQGRTALMSAVASRGFGCVELLLPMCDPLMVDLEGRSALHYAIFARQFRMSQLLAPVSDLGAVTEGGDTALSLAVKGGCPRCVELALPGSNLCHLDRRGRCLMDLAIERAQADVIEMLAVAGAPIVVDAENGWSALHAAAMGGKYEAAVAMSKSPSFGRAALSKFADRGVLPWEMAPTGSPTEAFLRRRHALALEVELISGAAGPAGERRPSIRV